MADLEFLTGLRDFFNDQSSFIENNLSLIENAGSGSLDSISSTLVRVRIPQDVGSDVFLNFNGSFSFTSFDLDSLIEEIRNGAAGNVTSATVVQSGSTILTATFSATTWTLASSAGSVIIDGALSNSVAILGDILSENDTNVRPLNIDRLRGNDGTNDVFDFDLSGLATPITFGNLIDGDTVDPFGADDDVLDLSGITDAGVEYAVRGSATGPGFDILIDEVGNNNPIALDLAAATTAGIGLVGNGLTLADDTQFETVIGGAGGDRLRILNGTDFDHRLEGRQGNDTLVSAAGDDTLIGGAGNDVLDGGAGNDRLVGGGDADSFVISGGDGVDTIEGFGTAEGDRIVLDKVDGFDDFNDVLGALSDDGTDTTLDLGGGNTVLIQNVLVNQLNAGDFAFERSIDASQLDGSDGFFITSQDGYSGLGADIASVGDINGDGFDDFIMGVPYSVFPGTYYGNGGEAVVVFGSGAPQQTISQNGISNGAGGFRIFDSSDGNYDSFGSTVSTAGDINGDGFDDLLVGSNGNKKVAVIFGQAGGLNTDIDIATLNGTNGFVITSTLANAFQGAAGAGGDFNNDGFDDIVLSDDRANGDGAAATVIVFGKAAGFAASATASSFVDGVNGVEITSTNNPGRHATFVGDVDGDGFDDVAVHENEATGNREGVVNLILGTNTAPASQTIDTLRLTDGGTEFRSGRRADFQDGLVITALGDIDGNGRDDFAIGDPEDGSFPFDDPGQVYVLTDGLSFGFNSQIFLPNLFNFFGFEINGAAAGDQAGQAVSSGDFDGDGQQDLLIVGGGNPYYGNQSEAYILFGGDGGFIRSNGANNETADLSNLDGTIGALIAPLGDFSRYSSDAAFIGDVNGDGFDDIAISSDDDAVASGNDATQIIFGREFGSPIDQVINGSGGPDTLIGSGGNDSIFGGADIDELFGNAGNDRLEGGAGNDFLFGGSGNDLLLPGTGGFHEVSGGAGDDTYRAVDRTTDVLTFDRILSGAGNDTFEFINPGHLFVEFNYTGESAGINVNLGATTGTITKGSGGVDTIIGHDQFADGISGFRVNGTSFDDVYFQNLNSDQEFAEFRGNAGDDSLTGGATGFFRATYFNDPNGVNVNLTTGLAQDGFGGTDTLTNIDEIHGSAFSDTLVGDANDNRFITFRGGSSVDGGAGRDLIRYDRSGVESVNVDLNTGTAVITQNGQTFTDTLVGIEDVRGALTGNDTIIGDANDNVITGGGGFDRLDGGDGDDTLVAGRAANPVTDFSIDTLVASAGNDTFDFANAGAHFSILDYTNQTGAAVFNIGNTTGTVNKASGETDTLINVDQLDGLVGGMQILGTAFADTITVDLIDRNEFVMILGGQGNDTITGGGGFDRLSYFNATQGVNVNLGAGTAIDEFGNTDSISQIDEVQGSDFADTLIGSAGRDRFIGRGGNDTINGGAEDDLVRYDRSGVENVDVDLAAGTATGTRFGTAFTHTLIDIEDVRGGRDTNSTLRGNDEGNLFRGGTGDDSIDGRDGLDTMSFFNATGPVTVTLDTQSTATGGAVGNDTIDNVEFYFGTAFDDTFIATANFDNGLSFLFGDQRLFNSFDGGLGGNDDFQGNGGTRIQYREATGGIVADMAAGTVTGDASVGNDTFDAGIFEIRGSAFGDSLLGSNNTPLLAGFESFIGGDGVDTIDGRGGEDRVFYLNSQVGVNVDLQAGTGIDEFGNTDVLISIEHVKSLGGDDTLFGDAGNNVFEPSQGVDLIDGRGGIDTIAYDDVFAAVFINLNAGTATDDAGDVDTLISIENAIGSNFDDTLLGGAGANRLEGLFGNDSLGAGPGNDSLFGGEGNDTLSSSGGGDNLLSGGVGNDSYVGAAGEDRIVYTAGLDTVQGFAAGAGAGDVLDLSLRGTVNSLNDLLAISRDVGNDLFIEFNPGVDVIILQGVNAADLDADDLFLAAGQTLVGDANANTLTGAGGDDTIQGLAGDDSLQGAAGADSIEGGDGNDVLEGGEGNDVLIGGNGSDTFLGGAGDDTVLATGSDPNALTFDRIEASRGNDTFDFANPGLLFPTLDYDSETSGITVTTSGTNGTVVKSAGGTDQLLNIDQFADFISGFRIDGTQFADSFTLTLNNNNEFLMIVGSGGNDTITGVGDGFIRAAYFDAPAAVNVNLTTGVAQDGFGGTDSLSGIDEVQGTDFADVLIGSNARERFIGRSGDDTIDGGGGTDLVRYDRGGVETVTVDLAAGTATGTRLGAAFTHTLSNIEEVRGSRDFASTLRGDGGSNLFRGGVADDVIDGRDGFDTVEFANVTGPLTITLSGTTTASGGGIGTDTISNVDRFIGSGFNDTLTADGNFDNGISFLFGNQRLFNRLEGGDGDDSITGNGATRIEYGNAANGIVADMAAGTVTGQGNDTFSNVFEILGSSFGDSLLGSNGPGGPAGFESFIGGDGADTIDGRGGNDRVFFLFDQAGVDVDLLAGTAVDAFGNTDTLLNIEGVQTGDGDDTLRGDNGDNFFEPQDGADLVDGRGGIDTVQYNDRPAGVNIDLAAGTALDANGDVDTLIAIENIGGSNFDDTLLGDSLANVLEGFDGNDSLNGGAGADTLDGGAGTDTLSFDGDAAGVNVDLEIGLAVDGSGANDQLSNFEAVVGSAFGDVLAASPNGSETLDGGAGNDTLFGGDPVAVGGANGAQIFFGGAGNDVLAARGGNDIANMGDGNDSAAGEDGNDSLSGEAGNDTLNGGAGEDTLRGGDGEDTLIGGAGNDTLDGGAGDNTVDYSGEGSGIAALLQSLGGTDGTGNADTYINIKNVIGSNFVDNIAGDGNGNRFDGNDGNDVVQGLGGSDTLSGDGGDDQIFGGDGNDFLFGGAGANTLQGGAGNDSITSNTVQDRIIYDSGVDTIAGFNAGPGIADVLDISSQTSVTNLTDLLAISLDVGSNLQIRFNNGVDEVIIRNVNEADLDADDFIFAQIVDQNLVGDNNANTLTGAGGNDTIDGLGGNDSLAGAGGDDSIQGGDGDDSVDGGIGNDTLRGGEGNDTVEGGAGNDFIAEVGSGNDALFGGDGNDTLSGQSGGDSLFGGAGDDQLSGGNQNDSLEGGDGNDFLNGEVGADTVLGGAGNDTVNADAADNDNYDGGLGTDRIVFSGNGVVVDLNAGTAAQVQGSSVDTLASFEEVFGTGSDDTITAESNANTTVLGGAGNDVLFGGSVLGTGAQIFDAGSGNDTVVAQGGDDSVDGGDGNDSLVGGEGNDTLNGGTLNDTLDGGADEDNIDGGSGADSILGGSGNDFLTGNQDADVVDGGAGNDFAFGGDANDTVSGGDGNDVVGGDDGDDSLTGGSGDDTITGGLGADTAQGGDGADSISGNDGADSLAGEAGNDTLNGGAGADTLLGGSGADNIDGGEGADVIDGGDSNDFLTGNEDADSVLGGGGNDFAFGGAGNDTVDGGDGDDVLGGDNGDDSLTGGIGADTLTGGAGSNTLQGGAGNDSINSNTSSDVIVYDAGVDIINGFDGGAGAGDVIDLTSQTNINDLNDLIAISQDVGSNLLIEFVNGFDELIIRFTNIADIAADDFIFAAVVDQNLVGDNNANTLTGAAGNDTIDGLGGNDSLAGEGGNDSILGGDGDDILNGGDGNDTLQGGEGNNTLNGGTGNDFMAVAGAGNDSLVGGDGNDTLNGSFGADTLIGGVGNDNLGGGNDNDSLEGGIGDDTLNGGVGNDTLVGGDGNDFVIATSAGNSSIYAGGTGTDTISFNSYPFANVDLNTGIASGQGAGVDTLSGFEHIIGSTVADTIVAESNGNTTVIGGSGDDSMFGGDALGTGSQVFDAGSGNDVVVARGGADSIEGGDGDDSALGEGGNDTLQGGAGNDTLDGGADEDNIDGGAGADSVLGGSGNDFLTGNQDADVVDGGAGNDFAFGGDANDTVSGGDGNDVVGGDDGDDSLTGGAGDDTITGGVGADTALGGDGADSMSGNDGADSFSGEAGNDTLAGNAGADTLLGGSGADNIDGGEGADVIDGGDSNDFLTGNEDADSVLGGGGNDFAFGGAGNDTVDGGDGDDVLGGDNGDDSLTGGIGADTLTGGSGSNTLQGGAGNDSINSNTSSDVIVYDAGVDIINGFDGGAGAGDVIDLTSQTNINGLNELIAISLDVGSNLLIEFVNGVDELIIRFTNIADIAADDFIFAPVQNLNLVGSNLANTLTGDEGNDTISGLGGNDTISGLAGNDSLLGGSGADQILGGSGADTIIAGADNDNVTAGVGNDVITGNEGDDTLDGGFDDDSIDGGTDNDLVQGNDGNDTLTGGAGNDTLDGGAGADEARHTGNIAGFDFLLNGETLTANDTVGTEGADSITLTESIVFADATMTVTTRTNSIDSFFGGNSADAIIGLGGNDDLRGNGGNDVIGGGTGGDQLLGNDGDDSLFGETGNDRMFGGNQNDSLVGGAGVDTINGDNGDDLIDGGDDLDFLTGGGGNDTMFGGTGNDRITAGAGNDSALGGAGNDQMFGQDENDTLRGEANNDRLDGGAGDDLLDGGDGGDVLLGQAGNDTLFGGDALDLLFGGEGNNSLDGGAGNDLLQTGSGADVLNGGAGVDDLQAGAGNDTLSGGDDTDIMLGGDGNDLMNGDGGNDRLFGEAGNDTLDGGAGDDRLDGGAGVNSLSGGLGSDTLLGGVEAESFNGGDGNDVVFADGGNDTIDGGDGLDRIDGGLGDDVITTTGTGNDTIVGRDGNDTITTAAGNDIIFGENGSDSINSGLGNDLVIAGAGLDTLIGGGGDDFLFGGADQDNIQGGDGRDRVDGGSGNNVVSGGAGIDTVIGRDGADILSGDAGDDLIIAGLGNDTISGGADNDRVIAQGGEDSIDGDAGNDTLEGREGNDSINGGDGADFIFGGADDDFVFGGNGNDTLIGEAGNDILLGDAGDDFFEGRDGNDSMSGGDGNDFLNGQAGVDELIGSAGIDTLSGGLGDDCLTGGADADEFRFANLGGPAETDTITDFEAGTDTFRLFGLTVQTVADADVDSDGQVDDTQVTFSNGSTVGLIGVTGLQESDLF